MATNIYVGLHWIHYKDFLIYWYSLYTEFYSLRV